MKGGSSTPGMKRAGASVTEHGGLDPESFPKLAKLLRLLDGDYNEPTTFDKVAGCARARGTSRPLPGHPPQHVFPVVVENLASAGCTEQARVIVEKPFGRDLASAQALNETLRKVLPEEAIFRIDHYLQFLAAIATSRTWHSYMATYAALRLWVDSWRWESVPFYVRASACG